MGISRKRRVMWEDDAGDLIELGGLDESQGQVMDLIDGRLGDPRVGVTSLADELISDSAGELVADLSFGDPGFDGMVADGSVTQNMGFGQPDVGDRSKTFGDDSQFGG